MEQYHNSNSQYELYMEEWDFRDERWYWTTLNEAII